MPLTEEPEVTRLEIPSRWSVCTIRGINDHNRDIDGFGVALVTRFSMGVESPEPGTYHIHGMPYDMAGFADFLRDCKAQQPDAEIIFDESDWQVLKRVCGNVLSRLKGTLRSRA